jgi:hypothetical protein
MKYMYKGNLEDLLEKQRGIASLPAVHGQYP